MTACPRCGEPAERGQLVCLKCGNRIALKPEGGERRSFESLPAVAQLLCVVVIGAGLWIVFAGRFDTRRGAVRQSENLGIRYPGAYVQLVDPVS